MQLYNQWKTFLQVSTLKYMPPVIEFLLESKGTIKRFILDLRLPPSHGIHINVLNPDMYTCTYFVNKTARGCHINFFVNEHYIYRMKSQSKLKQIPMLRRA